MDRLQDQQEKWICIIIFSFPSPFPLPIADIITSELLKYLNLIQVGHNYPDFKDKNSKDVLWLNMLPLWVISKLDDLKFDILEVKGKGGPSTPFTTIEESWKDVVENPSHWWDNRGKKVMSICNCLILFSLSIYLKALGF